MTRPSGSSLILPCLTYPNLPHHNFKSPEFQTLDYYLIFLYVKNVIHHLLFKLRYILVRDFTNTSKIIPYPGIIHFVSDLENVWNQQRRLGGLEPRRFHSGISNFKMKAFNSAKRKGSVSCLLYVSTVIDDSVRPMHSYSL